MIKTDYEGLKNELKEHLSVIPMTKNQGDYIDHLIREISLLFAEQSQIKINLISLCKEYKTENFPLGYLHKLTEIIHKD